MAERTESAKNPDVVLIGAGIMSATLGILLKELRPELNIQTFERLSVVAMESSDAWNNAGTGHSALCELNYTPQREDGTIDTSKAVKIAEQFEVSKQFWAYLVEKNIINDPKTFINRVPHMSFVWGDENVSYLKKRHEALLQFNLFKDMNYSEDHEQLKQWMPLIMENRVASQKVAATRMEIGTDVNFGNLTREIFGYLKQQRGFALHTDYEVKDLEKEDDGRWRVHVKNMKTGKKRELVAKFVFIGAGGGSLPLLEKSDIQEGKGFGGFPVSGQWLKCTNPAVIAKHAAKVYGKASVGTPPMSVPHLDTRIIDGEKALLFGPYAGFSTKFLKHGSWMDLPLSIKLNNIRPMLAAGRDNIPLTKYLIDQVRQTPEERIAALGDFIPNVDANDWELEIAGQRVQVIKKHDEHGGILEFGTEIVTSKDGSIAALLGASPGASTSVSIMLELMDRCFGTKYADPKFIEKIKLMIPTFGEPIEKDAELCKAIRAKTSSVLKLD